MRLRTLKVRGLFGIFDHELNLNVDERITIIHGPNGFGKTVILTLLNDFFAGRYLALRRYPYEQLRLEFVDGSVIEVEPISDESDGGENPKQGIRVVGTRVKFVHPGGEPLEYVRRAPIRARSLLTRQLGNSLARYKQTSSIESRVRDELAKMLPRLEQQDQEEPEGLASLRKSLTVRFIETHRLVIFADSRSSDSRGEPAVERYARELAVEIKSTLAEYAEKSQALDHTFPRRLVSGPTSQVLTKDEILAKLLNLEKKRQSLIDAGLLDETRDNFEIQSEIDPGKFSVLTVYLNDVQEKLAVLDTLAAKIDLFRGLVRQRFRFKEMTISKDKGFAFSAKKGELALTALSSGEQHEIVLLYELLFKVQQNALVLIDEPEISLNVFWQRQFVDDLSRITKLSGFDVMIATHSPQIINDRRDLTVALKGPEGEDAVNGSGASDRNTITAR